MDASDIGRFGTLSLLRSLPAESTVTSYPIDDEELTIGCDQSCSLRLYYSAVSPLHAKITFIGRKAFLVVLGTNGILLDDAPLFPAATTAQGPTTVPLQNNSVIEIHKKRFRFTYPPKHLRPALINTPTRATPAGERRPLRLSMIASAHVFTPRPSQDPQENLRILQTPLRTPFSREQEEIVLVHSNTPRVVEEDRDLVILDEYEPEPVLPLPLPVMSQYPATPVRRPRSSLHRAVLIRSAHRAALQREIEEEQDAEEVEETIGAIAEENDEDIQEIPPPAEHQPVSGWRKSLDVVKGSFGWAFRGLSVEPKEEEEEPVLDEEYMQDYEEEEEVGKMNGEVDYEESEYKEHDKHDNYDEEENDYHYEGEQEENADEAHRPLGQFMTPQIPRIAQQPRLSLGGPLDAGPRRVRVVAPWKVSEIQVPAVVKEECTSGEVPPANLPDISSSTPRSPVKREKLTDEERQAIRARRRSAVATPDNFFKGQTPGSRRTLFPSLALLPSPSFAHPSDSSTASSSQSTGQVDFTPIASTPATSSAPPVSSTKTEEDEDEDTAVLLARMKQMVEGVKQRRSIGRQSLNLSPRKREGGFSLLAPNYSSTHRTSRILIEEDVTDVREEEQEMHEEEEIAAQVPAHVAPKTPRMSDLRHVFGRPHDEAGTPALVGVREMFRPRPQDMIETPRMDGMKEMLEIPPGFSAPSVTANNSGDASDAERGGLEDEPVEELPTRAARAKKTPATRIARHTPVPQSAPAKSTRAASQAREETESVDAGTVEEGRTVRRTRARTADGALGQMPRATRTKVTKPTTPEPKEDEPQLQLIATATRSTRRTRQATDPSATSNAEEVPADDKPARKTRAKTPTPAPSTSTTKAGPARRGTRRKPIEVTEEENEEEDPLDFLPHERVQTTETPAPRPRRGGRSKLPVKQEEAEESVPPPPETESEHPARTTRARRTPVPKVPVVARGGARTRATAGASNSLAETAVPEDKENTPEPGAEEDEDEVKAATTKTRSAGKATRGSGRAVGRAHAEASEEAVVVAVTKTRAGRARAAKA